MRIIIADDHPVVLMGLKVMLQNPGGGSQVAGQANGGRELLKLLSTVPCDLLITDFSMPDDDDSNDGLLLLGKIRRAHPVLPVIVLTMVSNPSLIRGMLADGVRAVVDKASMMQELQLAMQAVAGGRTYLSESLRDGVTETGPTSAASTGSSSTSGNFDLSVREAEIVRLYASGLTITQIATQVHRSVKTVSQQKNDAMRKLGLDSNSQLYEYARLNGLLA